MNRRIRTQHAIVYIVLFYLAAAILLLGPGGVLKKDRLLKGNERIVGTATVRLDQQIQQVFICEGTYLKYLDLYVTSPESAGKNYRLLVYDELNQRLINREVCMPETEIPGFLRIPLGIETVPGRAYVWQLQGTDTPMDLAFENTGETGLVVFGNYYILENGEVSEQETQNIVMRLTYTDSPSAKKMAALYTVLILGAAFIIGAAGYTGSKRRKRKEKVTFQWVVRLTAGPALLGGTIYLIYITFVQNVFGGKTEDKVVYALGIGVAALFFAWVIFAKRPEKKEMPLAELVKKSGMDWLQAAAFAGALWGCIHFMNAQYQIWQDLAYREVLIWSFLVLLTMGSAREVFHKGSAIWIALSGLLGTGYYMFQKSQLAQEQAQTRLLLLRDDILIVMTAGLVALALVKKIKQKSFAFGTLNRLYAGALAVFLILLVAFRNTRGWPVYLALIFGLFYLFYIGWENRERLLANFCGGVMLNFALACVFALARRPFRAWVYSRYNFVFHTVTITATYLTLVVCALTVRLLWKLKEGKRMTDLWGTALLYGLSVSFLFLTLSRTGYLAVIVMTVVMAPFVTLVCGRQRFGTLLKNLVCMAAAALLCLPAAYTGVRILPAIYNDPYIFEVEESGAAIHRDDPKDSTGYMSVSYFKYVMENKLFAEAVSDREELEQFMLCFNDGLFVRSGGVLLASNEDLGPQEDFSNGRFEIFRCYMEEWNLTGHDEMGVMLPDGSVSVHAHNTYLQVIHDHGLITGIAYLAFGLVSACMMFVFAVRKYRENAYAALPLAIFIGFAIASLVEWLFHPCNPLGYSTMVIFAPLLCFSLSESEDAKKKQSV